MLSVTVNIMLCSKNFFEFRGLCILALETQILAVGVRNLVNSVPWPLEQAVQRFQRSTSRVLMEYQSL